MSEDRLNAHIHLSEDAPHRLRRAEDRERNDMRLRLWTFYVNNSGSMDSFDLLQAVLDEHTRLLTELAVRRLGNGGL